MVPLRSPSGNNFRRKLSLLSRLPSLLSTIARECRRADAIHVPVPGDIPLLAMVSALVLRKPLIVRYGSSWHPTPQATLMNRLTKWMMRVAATHSNVMLATGDGMHQPSRNVHWIFATALTKNELQAMRPALDRCLQSPPRLVYLGRLSPEKGVVYLLEALAQLQQAHVKPLPHLTILGDGPQRSALIEKARELDCQHLVHFAGQVDRDQLAAYLEKADLCVQPSLTEGFCKAWLDAMAYGLPVIATEVGAAPAVIGQPGERGWTVPPGNVTRLTACLRYVLESPVDWPAMRHRCRSYAQNRTLESWSETIGNVCAQQWNVHLIDGKLRKAVVPS